jgi:predicted RNase H-like HicB family nuclease
MASWYFLNDYVGQAMPQAVFDKLEDGTFTGRIPAYQGVIAFGGSLRDCESELQSTLGAWILLGPGLGHPLPVLGGIDLNKKPAPEALTPCKDGRILRNKQHIQQFTYYQQN